MKKVLAWIRPQVTRFLLSVSMFKPIQRSVALISTVLMLWQCVQVPLTARDVTSSGLALAAHLLAQTPMNVDASGSFTVPTSGYARSMVFYQSGTNVTGEYAFNGSKSAFTGTVSGYTLTGTFTYSGSLTFSATYAADGLSFAGTDPWGSFTGTKQNTAVIRVIPTQAVLKVGTTLSIDGLIGGVSNKSIAWTTTGGTVSASGAFTAPSTPGTCVITATSSAQTSVKATTTVLVTGDGNLDASGSFTVPTSGYTRSIVFYQSGTNVTGEYAFNGSKSAFTGTVSGYTLTGTFTYSGSRTFSATYAADGLSFAGADPWGSFTGTKQNTAVIRVIPTQAVLKVGTTLNLDGQVGGVTNKNITWSATSGTVSSNGVYTAPGTPGMSTVTAASAAQPIVKAQTLVAVTLDGNLDISGQWKIGNYMVNLYQSGTSVTGEYLYSNQSYPLTGTVNRYKFTGSFLVGTTSYAFDATLAPDGKSWTGTSTYVGTWNGVFQPGVILKLTPTASAILKAGDTKQYTAQVGGVLDKTVTWSATAGTIVNGLYTAPSGKDYTAQTITVKANADATKTLSAQVTILPGGQFDVSGQWKVGNYMVKLYQSGTSVTGEYLYSTQSYPLTGTVNGYKFTGSFLVGTNSYTFDATLAPDDKSWTGTSTYVGTWNGMFQPGVILKLKPTAPAILKAGDTKQYTVQVGGVLDKAVTWSATAGTIVNGLYTAPSGKDYTAQTITVKANADATKTASAQVSITPTGILKIAGVYKDASNYNVLIWQQGAQVLGQWQYGGTKYQIEGALNGFALTGKLFNPATPATTYALDLTVAPDGLSFKGIITGRMSNWICTRQSGVTGVFVLTPTTFVRPQSVTPLKAYVVGNANSAVTWSVVTTNGGAVDSQGEYTAPTMLGTYSVQAKSVAVPTAMDAVSLAVRAPMVIQPKTMTLSPIQSYPFSVQMTGFTNNAVTWRVKESNGGSITSAGVYTTPDFAGLFTVEATSIEDTSQKATAQVTVLFQMSITPGSATLPLSGIQTFQATVKGTPNKAVDWSVSPTTGGSITTAGVYTAPATISAQGTRVQVIARSKGDTTKTAAIYVMVNYPVYINPPNATVGVGKNSTFSAIVTGKTNNAVTWSVVEAKGGVITSAGVYTAPLNGGTFHVKATSVQNPAHSFTATVTVPVEVVVNPRTATTPEGGTVLYAATVKGHSDQRVTWNVVEAGGGTINSKGQYTAPTTPGTYTVRAVSVAVPAAVGTSKVVVPLMVSVSPDYADLRPGGSEPFKAVVWGLENKAVTWSVQEGTAGGTITSVGVYTAPTTVGTYHVIALASDGKTKGVAAVKVATGADISVVVSPSEIDLNKLGTKTFTALVEGGKTKTVTWTCTGGTITAATGAYTAPNVFGTYTVKATSTEDGTAYGTATVTVKAIAGTDKTFTYDANGNMTSDGTRTFEWDAENRLVSVTITATGHRSEFGYDGMGRRVAITEKDPDANQVLQVTSDKKYLWDGVEIAEERDTTGGIVQKRFYSQGFIDNDGTKLFYTRDHLGSIRELTDSSQTVRARYDYDPYGRMTKISGNKDTVFGYTGHLWHAQSGLNSTYYRAYDANLGRWINRDPVGERGGQNLYGYVENDSVNAIDISGLTGIYGNWCGWNWTGGRQEEYTPAHEAPSGVTPTRKGGYMPPPPDFYLTPIDGLDRACRTHDICYYQCRKDYPCNKDKRSNCFRICDYALTGSAYAIGGFWGDQVGFWIDRPGKRDPGPNDCGCQSGK